MEFHILNGMCLYDKFPPQIKGEKVVMNEALLYGPLGTDLFLEEFWKIRADFWKVSMNDYKKKTVVPLEKLTKAKKEDTILFWFGTDLFCQINVWFLLDFICQKKIGSKIGIIYPPAYPSEETFGHYPATFLANAQYEPVYLKEEEIKMAISLWNLCKNSDIEGLSNLNVLNTAGFPMITESINMWAALFPKEGKGIAQQKVEELIQEGIDNFKELFKAFSLFFPNLGMGDNQVFEYYQSYLNKKTAKK